MITCPACGIAMREDAATCPSCGRPNAVGAPAERTSWFSFKGRVSRKEYWLRYVLPLFAVPLLADVVDNALRSDGAVVAIISLLLIVPQFAGGWKRAHDRDRTGWFLLVNLIPFVGGIWYFVEIGFLPGTAGPNRFGPDPLSPARPAP